MTKSWPVILLLLTIAALPVQAQDTLRPVHEIGGSIFYSYSRTVSPFGPNDTGFDLVHQVQFEPTFGYYFYSGFEINIEPNYALTYSEWNTFETRGNGIYLKSISRYQTHRIGIFLGASYNLQIGQSLLAFLGTKVGFSSTRVIGSDDSPDSFGYNMDSGWRPAELSFPSFLGGVKFYFSTNWAFLIEVQYLRTSHYLGVDDFRNDSIQFGIGVLRSF